MKDLKINSLNAQKLRAFPHHNGLAFIIPFTCVADVDGEFADVDLTEHANIFICTMLIMKSVQYKSGQSGCVAEAATKLCNPKGFRGIDGLVMPQAITLGFRHNHVFKEYAKKVLENVV